MWTWAHLGLHRKPCALLDVNGFYSGLGAFLNHVQQEGFLRPGVRDMLLIDDDTARLLQTMQQYRGPDTPAWMNRSQT